MERRVKIFFDNATNGFIVRLPHMVTLEEIQEARSEFMNLLSNKKDKKKFSLLFDTGDHEFETLEALKYARTMLSVDPVLKNCEKFASVAPETYIASEVKSEHEAIFSKYQDAYNWLKVQQVGRE